MAFLDLTNVRKGFAQSIAVENFNLEVERGEFVSFLGPSGCGKTTTLRMIAGFETPTSGTIKINGVDLTNTPPNRRNVGMVFQSYALFPNMTVADNIGFGLKIARRPAGEIATRIEEMLRTVHLPEFGARYPYQLSGGPQQRVALARALAPNPRVLLLDEPLSALDATTRVEVRHDLKSHLDSFRGIRLVVTHDALEAMTLADRLVVIEDGHHVQTGTPAEVTERPKSRYVADLVGVNLLRGEAEAGAIQLAGGPKVAAAGATSGDVFAVIHPRAVSIHRSRPEGSPRNVWPGRASRLDLFGDRVRVRIEGAVTLVAEVTPAAVADLQLQAGGEVWASFKATDVAVYPA